MNWIETVNGLIALIMGLCGLIGTGIGAFCAIRNWIIAVKEKNAQEKWALIVTAADAAMKEAEASGQEGKAKKQMVIDMVKASCQASGLNIDDFVNQLGDYIDQCIAWYNSMKK